MIPLREERSRRGPSFALLACALASAGALAQQVTVPLDRYQELWNLANPQPPAGKPRLLLETAELKLSVGTAGARLRTEVVVDLIGGEPQTLKLPPNGSWIDCGAEGAELEVSQSGGERQLRLWGTGRARVWVESIPVMEHHEKSDPPYSTLRLDLPVAAVVRGEIDAGAGVANVEIAGNGGLVERAGEGRYRFLGEPGKPLSFELFHQFVAPSENAPLRFDEEAYHLVLASRARLRLTSWHRINVYSGHLEKLRLPVPPGFEVLEVKGPNMAGWQMDGSTLEIPLAVPVSGMGEWQIQLASDFSPEFPMPILASEGRASGRHRLRVAMRRLEGLLEVVDEGGAVAAKQALLTQSPGEFQAATGQPFTLAGGQQPPRYRVTWPNTAEVLLAQVDRLVVNALIGREGKVYYQAWVEARNAGASELRIALPAGTELVASQQGGRAVTPGLRDGEWVLPLPVSEEAQVTYLEAELSLGFPGSGGELALPLPALSAPASRIEVRAVVPPGYRYALAEAGRAGAVRPPPGGAKPNLERPGPGGFLAVPPGFELLQASWSGWSESPQPLRILVRTTPKSGRRP